jgi:hypothetical protein
MNQTRSEHRRGHFVQSPFGGDHLEAWTLTDRGQRLHPKPLTIRAAKNEDAFSRFSFRLPRQSNIDGKRDRSEHGFGVRREPGRQPSGASLCVAVCREVTAGFLRAFSAVGDR